MLKTFWLFRSLLPRWLCGVQDFVGTKNCLAEEDVQILEPTEIGPAAAADAGKMKKKCVEFKVKTPRISLLVWTLGYRASATRYGCPRARVRAWVCVSVS